METLTLQTTSLTGWGSRPGGPSLSPRLSNNLHDPHRKLHLVHSLVFLHRIVRQNEITIVQTQMSSMKLQGRHGWLDDAALPFHVPEKLDGVEVWPPDHTTHAQPTGSRCQIQHSKLGQLGELGILFLHVGSFTTSMNDLEELCQPLTFAPLCSLGLFRFWFVLLVSGQLLTTK